jgi:cytochrome c5
MASAQRALLAFAALLGATTLACGSAPSTMSANGATQTSSASVASNDASSPTSGANRDVHSIYRSRCGNCHVRVEPGSHTRGQLETAFSRHHSRVKMNDAEWSSMIDFLASDAPRSAMAAPGSAKSTSTEK